ncbi:hypothetical protein AYI68_g8126 [Smittium mucronatum]|uniref:Uncharacterized protein n=1 Tax=Smittium mucronatum TaxID=133383 RepID=A0A1R0GLS6_9FUNG|nr:hypothetical protein AYI68_g8126 [Smittium mucronatum]
MGMVMCNHNLVESCAYSYGFAPEISIDALKLSEDLDPSFNLAGEPVMEDLVSYFLGLSLSSSPNPQVVVSTESNGRSVDRRSKGAILALNSLLDEGAEYASHNALSVASLSATQQKFSIDDLYHSNWYRETASKNSF